MEYVKFIQKELIDAVKNIPIQNVIAKFFDNVEHKGHRASKNFEIYENDKYIFFVSPITNTVTIKELANNKTFISHADTIGLTQRMKFWTFFNSSNTKEKGNHKEEFKKSVIFLAKEFNLIKDIKSGKIELDLREVEAINFKKEQIKNEYLYKTELREQEAELAIKSFENRESLKFKKDFRAINKDLLNILIEQNVCKLFRNKEKGNRNELVVAFKNADDKIEGTQTIYYNIYQKKYDKRNKGDAQISFFGNKNAENIVITESFLDSASIAQVIAKLKKMDYEEVLDNYLFISINGELSNLKKETIKHFLKQNNVKKVILSHDNDKKGELYDKTYLKGGEFSDLVKDKNLVVFKPKSVKDFNDFIKLNEFKTKDFKDELIMQKATDYYKDYLKEIAIEENFEKEIDLEDTFSEEEKEEEKDTDKKHAAPLFSENVNIKLSEVLNDLMQFNTNKKSFYRIDKKSIKFTKFTARLKGVTKKGIYSVFFSENDFIEINKKGKEKGSGVAVLLGKNITNKKNIKNIVFSTNVADALKILKATNTDIKNSLIVAIKSVSKESEIIYKQIVEHFILKNVTDIENIFIITNDKKIGKFLEKTIDDEDYFYNVIDLCRLDSHNTNLKVFNEDELKNINLIIDVFNNNLNKNVKKNPKKGKGKEIGLSV